jgi:hypothetical protein
MTNLLASHRSFAIRSAIAIAGMLAASTSCSSFAVAQGQVPQQMKNQAVNLARVCKEDYDRLCQGVQPGGGRILGCLNSNAEKLSAACRGVLPDAQALASRAAATGVMPK